MDHHRCRATRHDHSPARGILMERAGHSTRPAREETVRHRLSGKGLAYRRSVHGSSPARIPQRVRAWEILNRSLRLESKLLALFVRFASRRCTWPYISALNGPPSLGRSGTSTALGRGAKSGASRLPSACTGVPAESPLLRPLRGAHSVHPKSRPIAHPLKGEL
jgi:hypothetical protein